tara:strand:+ start:260 stop:577 length:318 start_codon:yes stop_codon:yes gene_type:complete
MKIDGIKELLKDLKFSNKGGNAPERISKLINELEEVLMLYSVSGSAFAILNKGEILENILFKTLEEARNYIKMKYPKRNFKEPQENVFVCAHYGTKFIIQENHYR